MDTSAGVGQVSQSLQIAPFNAGVQFVNGSPETTIYDAGVTHFNSFKGTALQQSVSGVSDVDGGNYNGSGYATYGELGRLILISNIQRQTSTLCVLEWRADETFLVL